MAASVWILLCAVTLRSAGILASTGQTTDQAELTSTVPYEDATSQTTGQAEFTSSVQYIYEDATAQTTDQAEVTSEHILSKSRFQKVYSFRVPADEGNQYSLDVQLKIPGNIILKSSDADFADIQFDVTASAASWNELENMNIDFNVDEKTRRLSLSSSTKEEKQPLTPPCDSAWKQQLPVWLMTALLSSFVLLRQPYGWTILLSFLVMTTFSTIVQSQMSPEANVVITIPRGYSFTELSLYATFGKVKVEEEHVTSNPLMQCSTKSYYRVCPSCCRGLGECIDGQCICANSMASPTIGCDPSEVTFRLTVENFQTDDIRDFRYSTCVQTIRKPLEEILQDHKKMNPVWRYDGEIVDHQMQRTLFGFTDDPDEITWSVTWRNPDGTECVKMQMEFDDFEDFMVPDDSEHIVLAYKSRDLPPTTEECFDLNTANTGCPQYPPDIYVTVSDESSKTPTRMRLTVENTITDDIREFTFSLCAHVSANSTLIQLMNETATNNPALTYKTKSFSFGEYIYMVNGLEEDQSMSTYWAIKRRDPFGHDCWTSVGASDYHPIPGEHLVLSLTHYSGYDSKASCDELPEGQTPVFNLEDPCFS